MTKGLSLRRWLRAIHPRLRSQVEIAISRGWTFQQVASGHVHGFDADGVRRFSGSYTPSDWRAGLKAASNLRKALSENHR